MSMRGGKIFCEGGLAWREWGPNAPSLVLLCLAPAGGNSTAFIDLIDHLPSRWSCLATDLPGHGLARGEPLKQMHEVLDLLQSTIVPRISTPCVVLGHSFGGVVGHQLCTRIERSFRQPLGLVLCASKPPHLIEGDLANSGTGEDALVAMMERLDGVPADLLKTPRILAPYVKVLRADLEMVRRLSLAALDCFASPTLLIAGREDTHSREQDMAQWGRFCWDTRNVTMEGGHFFPRTDPIRLAAVLKDFVQENSLEPLV